jgi:hypothetical protein
MAKNKLVSQKIITGVNYRFSLWSYCDAHNIVYRTSKHENCLKREVIQHGS